MGSSYGAPAAATAATRSPQNEAPCWARWARDRVVHLAFGALVLGGQRDQKLDLIANTSRTRPSVEPSGEAPSHTRSPEVQRASRSAEL